jgi:hypothetical protein
MRREKPLYPNKLLVLGAAILIAGGILLLWNLGYLPQLGHLWPLPFMIVGMFMLYRAYLRGGSTRYIIPGMIFSLGGLFFLLVYTVLQGKSMEKVWPFFMLITGLSLIPYGYKKRGAARTTVIIPAIFIAVLSLMFLPFSLGTAGVSFLDFVRHWWPLILIVLGLALIVSFFSSRKPSNKI